MANTNVFRGSDATLVLAVDDNSTVEGGLADGLINEYEFSNIVGRLRNVELRVVNDVKPYHEIGKRFPTEKLRPGNVSEDLRYRRKGTYQWCDAATTVFGDAARSPPPGDPIAQPTFNIVVSMKNPATPDSVTKVVVFGVKFETWSIQLPEDDFVMEAVASGNAHRSGGNCIKL